MNFFKTLAMVGLVSLASVYAEDRKPIIIKESYFNIDSFINTNGCCNHSSSIFKPVIFIKANESTKEVQNTLHPVNTTLLIESAQSVLYGNDLKQRVDTNLK